MAKFWTFLDESGTEDKKSGKRVMGAYLGFVLGMGFFLSGFECYEVNMTAFITISSLVGGLLGVGVVKNILAKKDQ